MPAEQMATPDSLPGWLQLGACGVLAFVAILMMIKGRKETTEQRDMIVEVRTDMRTIKTNQELVTPTLVEVKTTLAALLERDRMRWERKLEREKRLAMRPAAAGDSWDDLTEPLEITRPAPKRARTDPYGVPTSTSYSQTKRGGEGGRNG